MAWKEPWWFFCLPALSSRVASSLFASMPPGAAVIFAMKKKGGTENFPEKKHSRMFPGKRVGWKTMPLLLQWFLFGGHVSSARVVGFGDPPCLFLEGTDRFVKKDTAKGCQSSV